MSQTLKIGIIGAGAIVESCHIPVLLNHPNFRIEWIYDHNVTRSETLAEMYGISQILNEGEWKNNLNAIDICLLAIPYGARKEYIEEVAKQKKYLYVEKPFALSVNEHKKYCDLYPEYGISIGFQRRMYSILWELKSIIDNRIFGQLRKINFILGNFSLKGGSGYLSNPKLSGGGLIVESIIHFLDQILLLTNTSDFKIGQKRIYKHNNIEYDVDFYASLTSKTNAQFEFEAEVSTLRNLDNGLRLIFDHAEIYCELRPQMDIKVKKGDSSFYIRNEKSQNSFADNILKSFHLFWQEFHNAIQTKSPNLSSGISSILTTAFIENIYEPN